MKTKEQIKQELLEIAYGKIEYWWTYGKWFKTYYGSYNKINFEISRGLFNTKLLISYTVPIEDDWCRDRRVNDTFIFSGLQLYNQVKWLYETRKKKEREVEEANRKKFEAQKEQLKQATLSKLLEKENESVAITGRIERLRP